MILFEKFGQRQPLNRRANATDGRVSIPGYRRSPTTSALSVENQYLVGASSPSGHSISASPLVDSQRASNLDALHERARGQSVRTTALPWLPAT